MQRLEVSGAVRPLYGSLGVKGLIEQYSKFLLHTLQALYMWTLCDSTNINTIIEFVRNCL